jgi:hypothetical protein
LALAVLAAQGQAQTALKVLRAATQALARQLLQLAVAVAAHTLILVLPAAVAVLAVAQC